MKKFIKWIIGILIIVIITIILIPIILPLFVDPNDYKDKITQKVLDQTGRTMTIPGDIQLDFSLIGLNTVFQLGEVNLSASKDFPDTDFFSSDKVEINLALWPLIKNKELVVNKIGLEGVNLNLVKDQSGKSNWEDLQQKGSQPAPSHEKQTRDKAGQGLSGIDIGAIQAKDINLTYTDKQVGNMVKFSIVNLDTGNIRQGRSFPFTADFAFYMENPGQKPLSAKIKTSSNFTFSPQSLSIEGFKLDGLIESAFSPNPLNIAVEADIALEKQKIDVKRLVVRQGEAQLETTLTISDLTNPEIAGSVTIPSFSPRTQAGLFGLELPLDDPHSLTDVSLMLDFAGNQQEFDISKMKIKLDESTLDGKATVKNLTHPSYDITLHIDQLDLDKYTVKKTDQETKPTTSPEAQEKETTEQAIIPSEKLREISFNAQMTIGMLKAAKLKTTNIQLTASGKDGLIQLDPFAADLYDGKITGFAEIDARQDMPGITVKEKLHGVQLGPMFIDMTGKEEISGRADIQANITSRGSTQKELKQNANGNVDISLADGRIAKLKIIDTIRLAQKMLGSKKEKQETSVPQLVGQGKPTEFANLKATGKITNGVFKNNDLIAESELMRVNGEGTVDLVNEQIDYLLTVYLAEKIERDEKTGLVDLEETPIPYRIKGSFDKISQSAALEELVKTEVKKALFKELDKQLNSGDSKDANKEESSGKTDELLKKGLKSLFGN